MKITKVTIYDVALGDDCYVPLNPVIVRIDTDQDIYGAMSAIDEALWDIKGKMLGVPVYELLGGKVREEIRLYASGWYPGSASPADYAETYNLHVQPHSCGGPVSTASIVQFDACTTNF